MKMYNIGDGDTSSAQFGVPTIKKMGADGKVRECVKAPETFGAQLFEHQPGNVYLPLDGAGFFVVPKGKYVEVPGGFSMKAIKDLAPHLLSEEEFILAEQSKDEAVAGDEPKIEDATPADKPRRGRPPQQ